ncbi:MAG TPA: AAA family ATPase [Conexibacter sp.]|nr:AAA family ATPase [Conexibacter sp.]
MPTTPPTRSVKFSDDERGGWSSDRPRRDGGPQRPADISVRCRILTPSDRMRYSPGSLVLVVAPSAAERDRFIERVIEERAAILSLDKVRGLLAGRVPDADVEPRAQELLTAAIRKRIEAGETVVLAADGLGAEAREPYVRMAAAVRRPRHLILLEAGRDGAQEEDRAALDELRRALVARELGAEGIQTALRLSGGAIAELKRIVFRPPPRDD